MIEGTMYDYAVTPQRRRPPMVEHQAMLAATRAEAQPASHPVTRLQRSIGNRAVGEMLQRRPAAEKPLSAVADRQSKGSQKGPSRKDVFCYKCAQKKTLKVAVYSQADSDFRRSNITFARVFMMNHNVDLDIDPAAGVIPTVYDEENRRSAKVESVADLCDILKELGKQPGFPPPSGVLPALFIPFGKQLGGAAAEALGWHIPDINQNCEPHVGKLGLSRIILVDSNLDIKSCAKVLLHEIGHAVGNPDVKDSNAIMGPCDPAGSQSAPIGCQPDRTDNLMSAIEVKKFCEGSF